MTKISFSELNLTPKVERAIVEMGFDFATPVQSEAIPLIRKGFDVIARSQTGTGKTVAFAIPAIEQVDSHEGKNTIQVLILCPTRELAQQAAEEIRKVARYMTDIRPVEIYGGAAIDKQCVRLRKANIVVGTPGRIMDHMRRRTIRLDNLKLLVLDEADEMLNMGFKEDIETILKDAPAERQTVMFSATMPPAILKLTREFQKDPKLVEIDKGQVTIEDIEQTYLEVPHDRKKDALVAFLNYNQPNRAIIFCNTKRMVDDLAGLLGSKGFSVESIHSDIRQSQRTSVMYSFKQGKTAILLATDIAARGIDVSDVDFVINFDIPMNSEYYVHRIGRTGRAGKSGRSVTICSGRREVITMRNIARDVKSEIKPMTLPTTAEVNKSNSAKLLQTMEEALHGKTQPFYGELADQLVEMEEYSYRDIAAAAMQRCFANDVTAAFMPLLDHQKAADVFAKGRKKMDGPRQKSDCETIQINIGSSQRAAVNHIVGAITERTNLVGSEIGKVKVLPNQTIVEIPSGRGEEVLAAMKGCKICGRAVITEPLTESFQKSKPTSAPRQYPYQARGNGKSRGSYGAKKPQKRYGQ